jgi:hypothetical protein
MLHGTTISYQTHKSLVDKTSFRYLQLLQNAWVRALQIGVYTLRVFYISNKGVEQAASCWLAQ